MSNFDALLQQAADLDIPEVGFTVSIEDGLSWHCECRTTGMDGVDFMFFGDGRTKTTALRRMLEALRLTVTGIEATADASGVGK